MLSESQENSSEVTAGEMRKNKKQRDYGDSSSDLI
jgi:hypothetical protein